MSNNLNKEKIFEYINNNIEQNIIKNNLIKNNDKVIIGVSGGPDSMCLLYSLITLKEKFEQKSKINKLLLKNAVDCDKICGKLILRTREAGDKISPLGRGVSKPVRRIQSENNLPVYLRENAPIASDEQGVIWGYKIGTDKRVAIDDNTKKVLVFKVYES